MVQMLVADLEVSETHSLWAAEESPANPLADLACIRPPMKWHGITAQATSAMRQFSTM